MRRVSERPFPALPSSVFGIPWCLALRGHCRNPFFLILNNHEQGKSNLTDRQASCSCWQGCANTPRWSSTRPEGHQSHRFLQSVQCCNCKLHRGHSYSNANNRKSRPQLHIQYWKSNPATKAPPTSWLLKQALGIQKASARSQDVKVGTLSMKHIYHIAIMKSKDEAFAGMALESVCSRICAQAAGMGIQLVH